MTSENNDAQIRFWNSGPGSRWATYQQGLDACFEEINQFLIARCDVQPGSRVLDVGCGTGATSIAFAETYGSDIDITALDASASLLELAQQRVDAKRITNIQFIEADAQTYAFELAAYDRLISRFGLMFFTDPVAALKNLASAMAPGSEMHFAAWGHCNQNPWMQIPLDAAIACFGEPEPVDPREPGPLAFADIDYLTSILRSAGLNDFSVAEETLMIRPNLPMPEIVDLACLLGPAFRLIRANNASNDEMESIKEAVERGFDRYRESNRVNIPACIVIGRIKEDASL